MNTDITAYVVYFKDKAISFLTSMEHELDYKKFFIPLNDNVKEALLKWG